MSKYLSLTEVIGADMQARYSIDGRRVSRAEFYNVKDRAARLECFMTKGKQLPGGKIRRTNYSTAFMA